MSSAIVRAVSAYSDAETLLSASAASRGLRVASLAAGERVRMQWWAAVGPMVRDGSTLTFTATASARECEGDSCPVSHTASVFITLE